jgi:hypothetical protein
MRWTQCVRAFELPCSTIPIHRSFRRHDRDLGLTVSSHTADRMRIPSVYSTANGAADTELTELNTTSHEPNDPRSNIN